MPTALLVGMLSLWGASLSFAADAPVPAAADSTKTASPSDRPSAAKIAQPTKEDLARWSKPMDQIQVKPPEPKGPLPINAAPLRFPTNEAAAVANRTWDCTAFQWCPSQLAYHPLYFDEVPLERYGQTPCPFWQPALSGAHFFGTIPLLPYKMLIDRPCDCIWDYGYYRPGSPTPCIRQKCDR